MKQTHLNNAIRFCERNGMFDDRYTLLLREREKRQHDAVARRVTVELREQGAVTNGNKWLKILLAVAVAYILTVVAYAFVS